MWSNKTLQPTPGSAFSSASRFTFLGPAWLSLGREAAQRMTRCLLLFVLSASMILFGAGCGKRSHFPLVTKGVSQSSSLTLYEGLPHQGWEADLLKKELATKRTVTIRGFPFYERPLSVAAADVEELRRLCAAADSFSTYAGPKACGGYHPDYCLSWKDGATTYELLICFGCHEMKFFDPKHEELVDIRKDAFERFEAILKKYRDQRPKTE
jgi:hypothetical protein